MLGTISLRIAGWTGRHPFQAIRPDRLGRVVVILAMFSLALIWALVSNELALESDAAPLGMLSFELAGQQFVSKSIVETWEEGQRMYAAFRLGADYLVLASVFAATSSGCIWAAGKMAWWGRPIATAGILLAWLQGVAALLGAIENFSLLLVLFDGSYEPWARIAALFAVGKYGLLGAGLLYVAFGPIAHVMKPAVRNLAIRTVQS